MVRVPSLPPALAALALFAVGLGGALAGAPGWMVALAAAAVWLIGPRPGRFLSAIAVAGWLHGVGARRADLASCAARLPAGPVAMTVRVMEPTTGGAPARVRPQNGGCRGAVSARFGRRITVRAGERGRIEGRWVPDSAGFGAARGWLIVARVGALDFRPSPVERLRNHLFVVSRALFQERAGMVDALVLGRRGWIDPVVTAAFARAGVVHLLSISGFHVGLIAVWAVLLLSLTGLTRRAARVAAVVLVAAYIGFIGVQAPALRAVIIATIGVVETSRQRRPRTGAVFALTALLVLVIDPWAVASLGAWLSVTALAGATAATRWSDRAIGTAAGWRLLFGSVGASLATAPVAAFSLGVVAVVGIPLNLVAIPLAAVAVPGVLASLVSASLWQGGAAALAFGSSLTLGALEWLATMAAGVPGAALTFEPGVWPALVGLAALGVGAWIVGRRNTAAEAGRRAGWIAALLLLLDLGPAALVRSDAGSRLSLHFLAVGQGDAAVLRTPHGHWILVDAGPRSADRDAGRRVVGPFLLRHGVRTLDAIVLSHAHLDHYGGVPGVLARVPAAIVLEPGVPTPDPGYRELLDAIDASGTRWGVLRRGARFEIDGVTFDVLHPDTTWAGFGTDLNEDSIVLRIRSGPFEALLGGDAGMPVEALLAGQVGQVDLLKVGHHGSAGATGAAWLRELAPRVAVVSTGPNRYGHPAPATMERLARQGTWVLRTDRDGTVAVLVDRTTMRVRSRRSERTLPIE